MGFLSEIVPYRIAEHLENARHSARPEYNEIGVDGLAYTHKSNGCKPRHQEVTEAMRSDEKYAQHPKSMTERLTHIASFAATRRGIIE